MNGKRWFGRPRLLLCALALILLGGMTKPAGTQDIEDITDFPYLGMDVECTSAILDSTDGTEIDTYSDTNEGYYGEEETWGVYEEAYLYDNNNQIDQSWAVDDGFGDAYTEMSDPVNLGDTYLLVTYHYLWDEGSCEDPYDDWDECSIKFGPGIQFTASATLPQGNLGQYQWVQLVNSDFTQWMLPSGPGPKTNSINGGSELDGTYPYGTEPYCTDQSTVSTTYVSCDTASDSPLSPLVANPNSPLNTQGEYSRSFNATMYLEWVPTPDNTCIINNQSNSPCAIEAPLGSIAWHWGGDAIDTLQQSVDSNGVAYQQWVVNTNQVNNTCPSPNCAAPQPFQLGGSLPTWTATDNPL